MKLKKIRMPLIMMVIAISGFAIAGWEYLRQNTSAPVVTPSCTSNCTPPPVVMVKHIENLTLVGADFQDNQTLLANFYYNSNGNQTTNAYIASWRINWVNGNQTVSWGGSINVTLPYTVGTQSYQAVIHVAPNYFAKGQLYAVTIVTNFGLKQFLAVPN